MNNRTNTLKLYCEFKGWQGGTIHQAMADFKKLSLSDKDQFYNVLISTMMNNTDLTGLSWFMMEKGNGS